MTDVFPLRHLTSRGLALLVALGTLQVVVAGDTSPSTSAAARVHRLAQNVERAESVRAVKRIQETYAQYSQFGLWTDMAALFADNAHLSYGKDNEQGRQAIQNYFLATFGGGTHGLQPGGLHTQMVLRPLINVAADGQSAKGRWWEFSMTGQHGVKAEWAAGIFENEYVRVLRVHYEPGEKGQTHEHILNRVVFYLNDQPGAKADDVRVSGAATHAEENASAQPADRIAVELK